MNRRLTEPRRHSRTVAVVAVLAIWFARDARAQTTPTSRPTTLPLAERVGSGISGPGTPFSPDGPVFAKRRKPNAPAVVNGLIPNVRPLMDLHLRDTIVRPGGDGNYYLTGSTGDDIWTWNQGVELWRSADLQHWDYLGVVWDTMRDGTWERTPMDLHGKGVVTIWAPEIIYLRHRKTYAIMLSMAPGGISILESTTGKPEGPYANAIKENNGKFRGGIDATLFEDDDGKVYFANGGAGSISLMKDDLSGIVETRKVTFAEPDHDPKHHAAKCEPRGMNDIGHEGAVFFKANGKYYLGAADSYEGRYSTCMAIADNVWGPYHGRFEAIPGAGGGDFFQDRDGNWWATYFGNDGQQPWREMPAIIQVDFAADGKIVVAKDQPAWNRMP